MISPTSSIKYSRKEYIICQTLYFTIYLSTVTVMIVDMVNTTPIVINSTAIIRVHTVNGTMSMIIIRVHILRNDDTGIMKEEQNL